MEFCLDDNLFWIDKDNGVSIKYRTLSIKDYQRLIRIVGDRFKGNADDSEKGMNLLGDESFMSLAKELVSNYCFDLNGIVVSLDGQKRNATLEDLFEYGVFADYLFRIVFGLMNNSETSTEEAEKIKK